MEELNYNIKYPSTRYSGSKRRFLDWIWENVKSLKFNSVLDVFGGTGSVSLLFKAKGKVVNYNDILIFNTYIGKAIIENSEHYVSKSELLKILRKSSIQNSEKKIQTDFKGIFFLDEENVWLDKIIQNIKNEKNEFKRAILYSSLFQSCLSKRPYNLFHRANLNLRTNNVERTFGNKTTWETPFEVLMSRFVNEYNKAVFSNGKLNRVLGGYDAFSVPNGVDLVYLDPPYFSLNSRDKGTNYLEYYHFLERIALYDDWDFHIKNVCGTSKKPKPSPEIDNFIRKSKISNSIFSLIKRFHKNKIVLSYQDEGIPKKEEIIYMFKEVDKKVKLYEMPHTF